MAGGRPRVKGTPHTVRCRVRLTHASERELVKADLGDKRWNHSMVVTTDHHFLKAVLPDAQFERGSIGEYKPRSGCSPLHGGCAWMRTGHSTQRARAAKHLGGK